jgi:hypothetical protein
MTWDFRDFLRDFYLRVVFIFVFLLPFYRRARLAAAAAVPSARRAL